MVISISFILTVINITILETNSEMSLRDCFEGYHLLLHLPVDFQNLQGNDVHLLLLLSISCSFLKSFFKCIGQSCVIYTKSTCSLLDVQLGAIPYQEKVHPFHTIHVGFRNNQIIGSSLTEALP